MQRSSAYSNREWEIVDHHPYRLEGVSLNLKGPGPRALKKGEYVAFLGSSFTFGPFCDKPFPTLLGEKFDVKFINFGVGGADPEFFLNEDLQGVLEYINNAKFVVVQIMTGRAASNSLFRSVKRNLKLIRISDEKKMNASEAYSWLLQNKDEKTIHEVLEETRDAAIEDYRRLFEKIKVPIVLFWFSKRRPKYIEEYSNKRVSGIYGGFPHIIDDRVVKELRKYSDSYVECITNRGRPHKLISRFTGEVSPVFLKGIGVSVDHNWYYPSPEMHEDAADALTSIFKKYLLK